MIRKRLAILWALIMSATLIPMSNVTVFGVDKIAVVSEAKEQETLQEESEEFGAWEVMPVSFDGLTEEDCTSIMINEECMITMQSDLFDHESVQGKALQFNWTLYKGIYGDEDSMKKFADLGDQRELTLKGKDLISAVNEMDSGENCLYIEAEIFYNGILLASGGFDIQLTCDMNFGDTLLTEDFICVFEDEIRDVTIFSTIFEFVNDVEVKWDLYSLNRETQSDDSKNQLIEYCKTGTANDYVIEGARFANLGGVDWNSEILRMRAAVCKGDYEFASREFTIDFYEKENYYYEDNTDIALVPGDEKLINGEIRGYVRDQDNPNGQKIFCEIKDVTVTNGEDVCSVYREGNNFKIVADNRGSAVVTVSYCDWYGTECTFDRIIHVNQDVLYLDVILPYNSDCVLAYSTTEISTVLIHKWNYSDGEQGTEKIDDYEINLMTDECGDQMYNQDLVDVSVLEDGKTLQVNAKDHLGESDIFINTEVQTDNGVSLFANANARVNIVDRYCYSEDFDYNANAKVEETINICPIIKYRRIENGEIITEDFDGYFWFDMDYEREEFTVDEIEGGIAITRKCDNNISMNIRCWSVKDNETFEVFSKQINFNAVDHEWVINYEWSKDLSKCEAKAQCKHDLETQTETVYSNKSVKKPATCKADEILSYSATFKNKIFATQTKSLNGQKALGHTYATVETKKATLSANGKITKKCSNCGDVITSTVYYPKTFTLSKTSFVYDGKVKEPTITIKDTKGEVIDPKYYTVTKDTGRKLVGKYNYKITFKTQYIGTKTVSFKINPKATTFSSVTAGKGKMTVKWAKRTTQINGYQIQYSKSSTFASGNKMVTISSNKTTSKSISNLTKGKKYYVRIRTYKTVNKVKYYSDWSAKKSVTTKK